MQMACWDSHRHMEIMNLTSVGFIHLFFFKFYGNPLNDCCDISVWTKGVDQLIENIIPKTTALANKLMNSKLLIHTVLHSCISLISNLNPKSCYLEFRYMHKLK